MKMRMYSNSCTYDIPSKKQSKIDNYKNTQSLKSPSLIYLRIGVEKEKTYKRL